jgi:hypothetical protein
MTEHEQQIAIAERCGWKWYRRPATGPWAGKPHRTLYHPSLHTEYIATLTPADMTERECNPVFMWREGFIPDYLHDLNAMHNAETACEVDHYPLREKFSAELQYVCDRDKSAWPMWRATAVQRSEALLRTIGKWKDHNPEVPL